MIFFGLKITWRRSDNILFNFFFLLFFLLGFCLHFFFVGFLTFSRHFFILLFVFIVGLNNSFIVGRFFGLGIIFLLLLLFLFLLFRYLLEKKYFLSLESVNRQQTKNLGKCNGCSSVIKRVLRVIKKGFLSMVIHGELTTVVVVAALSWILFSAFKILGVFFFTFTSE